MKVAPRAWCSPEPDTTHGVNAVQNEIALVQRNGQAFVSSHEIASKFSKRHSDVLRLIHSYLDLQNLNDFNKRNFALANDTQAGRGKRALVQRNLFKA